MDTKEKMTKDISLMLTAKTHIGTTTVNHGMKGYVGAVTSESIHLINLVKTWEKLMVAAKIIVAIENPADVIAIGMRPYANRAVLKFAQHTGAQAIAGRWTPGTLTNQITLKFMEPRLLIVTDPLSDIRAVKESFYANIPVIALCDTDCDLKYVDVAIPCNNRSVESIGLIYWMLAREVRFLRDPIEDVAEWTVMPDMFFYRDPEEIKKEEKEAEPHEPAHTFAPDWTAQTGEWGASGREDEWGGAPQPQAAAGGADGWGATGGGGEWGVEKPADETAKATWT